MAYKGPRLSTNFQSNVEHKKRSELLDDVSLAFIRSNSQVSSSNQINFDIGFNSVVSVFHL